MRLVYTTTGKPVLPGDIHTINGFELRVAHTPEPHKPDSEGKIDFYSAGGIMGPSFYCSIIGARWIEREDRAYEHPADAYEDFRIVFLAESARQDVPATEPEQAWRDFLDRAIAAGRAPAAAAGWSLRSALVPEGPDSADALSYGLSGTPFDRLKAIGDAIEGDRESEAVIASFVRKYAYNVAGHVCPSTGRLAMTVADAYARTDMPDRHFALYNVEAEACGMDPWRMIDGMDATVETGADGRPFSYTLDFADGRSVADISPERVIYMQRTKEERAA